MNQLSDQKKTYEPPQIEIVEFELEDITCSGTTFGYFPGD